MLVAENIWFSYDKSTHVLRDVSLNASPGQLVAVIGPTGSGKTTLLMILAGLLKPDKGRVLVDGLDPYHNPIARRLIGVLFQNPDDQLFNPTVYDDIAYALRTIGLSEDEIHRRVIAVANKLGITSILEKPPYRLSLGQRKLAAIATILIYDPKYLLLDEPLAFLDLDTALKITCIIVNEKSKGKGIIVTLHGLDPILAYADQVCRLRQGTIKCTNPENALSELLEHPLVRKHPICDRDTKDLCKQA